MMFRVPAAVLDPDVAQQYAMDECLDVYRHGSSVILEFHVDSEMGGGCYSRLGAAHRSVL